MTIQKKVREAVEEMRELSLANAALDSARQTRTAVAAAYHPLMKIPTSRMIIGKLLAKSEDLVKELEAVAKLMNTVNAKRAAMNDIEF